ncbi:MULTISPECIES: 4Fe-4S binding protein [unclassified Methanoregula]|nr:MULTISPECIES: 4Fe-4S binding protein [unclassified Methanoregula]
MAFAVQIIKEHCTGCNNCVVACPYMNRVVYPV